MSTVTLLIFFKLSSDLFGKSRISPDFFRNFWGLVSLVRPRTGRNLEVETSATTSLTDPRTLPLSQRLRSPNAVWILLSSTPEDRFATLLYRAL